MLTIHIPGAEFYDESTSEFITLDGLKIAMEHSLVSLSKWESKHEKPFLDKREKTDSEILDYVRSMIITPDVPDNIVDRIPPGEFERINAYIDAKMTATWFSDKPAPPSREIITSELIYYWMISFNIPMECQNWHLNRLLTLIRVCNVKNQPPKKLSKQDVALRNRELNARRKAQLGTTG